MASFFQKIEATQCTGKEDSKCENFVNHQRLPAHKRSCDLCSSPVAEITTPDFMKIGAVAFIALLLAGGVAYASRNSFAGLVSGIVHREDSPRPDQPRDTSAAGPGIAKVEIESDSGGRIALGDMDKVSATTFRARQSYHAGDKFRIRVDGKLKYLYVYYRSGSEARQLAAGTAVAATLPSESDWFQLDNTPGTEEFTFVSSNGPVSSLDELRGPIESGQLEAAVRGLEDVKTGQLLKVLLSHQ